jgi:hypothetical protein
VASVSHLAPVHLGLDVHRDTISVGILEPDQQVPEVERIAHDEPSVRRLVGRLGDPRRLRACYEAGPTGFELARLLHSMGVGCQVIAPSLIPKAPGDKVKTDKRDCRRLARLHRAGELSPFACRPALRKRCGICAAPALTWSLTAPAPGIGCRSSCCATAVCGAVGRPRGPRPTSGGGAASSSMNRRCRQPPRTTGWCSKAATRTWTRSRPTLPAGTTGRRSPPRSPA